MGRGLAALTAAPPGRQADRPIVGARDIEQACGGTSRAVHRPVDHMCKNTGKPVGNVGIRLEILSTPPMGLSPTQARYQG